MDFSIVLSPDGPLGVGCRTTGLSNIPDEPPKMLGMADGPRGQSP